ncbi:hypothetical protein BDZ89DRAFT_237260 [Hymenopellis radicata]|nr:hypothetical protein BDZ89DRAFT_237260 [Hymenopellis radicata]
MITSRPFHAILVLLGISKRMSIKRVLDVLRQQVMPDPQVMSTSTSVELRRMGLETLHEILQSSGHTLVVGWEMIFEMLGSVCKPLPIARTPSVDSVSALSSTSSPPGRTKLLLIGLGTPSEKSFTAADHQGKDSGAEQSVVAR